MKPFKKISKGFTYTELIVNIIIVNVVFISLAYVHYQIEQDIDYETNKSEMINYANHTLDFLIEELIKCSEFDFDPNPGTSYNLNLTYPDAQTRKFYINLDRGLFEVHRGGRLVHLDNPYNPRDKVNRLEHEISFFNIDQPEVLIWSQSANDARQSSWMIEMEIDLLDNLCDENTDECKKKETLKFKRTVFLPSNYIAIKGNTPIS